MSLEIRKEKNNLCIYINDGFLQIKDMLNAAPSIFILPTLSCNQDCSYCYLRGKERFNIKKIMSNKILETTLKKISDLLKDSKVFEVCFHGGEPLLAPLSFYEKASEIRRSLQKKSYRINFQIQTNLTLLNARYAKFFSKENIRLISSFDGTPYLQKVNRGRDFFYLKLKMLKKYFPESLNPMMVTTTLTRKSIGCEKDIYFYFKEIARELDCRFAIELSPVVCTEESPLSISPEEFIGMYIKINDFSLNDPNNQSRLSFGKTRLLKIMTLEELFDSESRFLDNYLQSDFNKNKIDFNWLVVGPKGDLFEGIIMAHKNKLSFGNIRKKSLKDILNHPLRKKLNKANLGLEACVKCEVFRYCRLDPCSGLFINENKEVSRSEENCQILKGIVGYYKDIIGYEIIPFYLQNKTRHRSPVYENISKEIFSFKKIIYEPVEYYG